MTCCVDIYKKSDDLKLKKNILFSISQNRSERAVKQMIEIARSESNLELKKQAVFWLGQTKSEEALKFLREIIDK